MHVMLPRKSLALVFLLIASLIIPAPAQSARYAPQVASTPVLLIVNNTPSAPFGDYLAALLDYEGLQTYTKAQLADVNPSLLSQYRLVILAETALSSQQATDITAYVTGGGRLIAMKPDAQIKALFGLGTAASALSSGYVKFSPAAEVRGEAVAFDLPQDTLQLFAPIDRYSLDPAAVEVARLYSDAVTPTPYPAVAVKGNAVAFTYDLARNVAYTRQGRPSGQSPAGLPVTQTQSLYEGWVNVDRIAIPQADEQVRLFTRLAKALLNDLMPLPQTWYFQGTAKTALLVASDAHANPFSYFTQMANSVAAEGGSITFYSSIGDELTVTNTLQLTQAGHSIAPLIYAFRPDAYPPLNIMTMEEGFITLTHYFTSTHGVPVESYRFNLDEWKGWTTAAELASQSGYRLDLSVRHYAPWLRNASGAWVYGHMTGGARPLPYVRSDGQVLLTEQQPVQLDTQHLFRDITASNANLDEEGMVVVAQALIDRSNNGDYAALTARLQTDYAYAVPALARVVAYARQQNAQLMNPNRYSQFVKARSAVRYTDLAWSAPERKLAFNAAVTNTEGLSVTTILPVIFGASSLVSVTVDGLQQPFAVELVKQQPGAFVVLNSGAHVIAAHYSTDVQLQAVSASNDSPKELFQPVAFSAVITPSANAVYVWSFGDGAFASGANPTHTYKAYPPGGAYVVSVRASNGQGPVTATTTVLLSLPPRVRLPMIFK